MWLNTYGNLYKKLITTTGEIPIGLYRTINEENQKKQEKQNVSFLFMHLFIYDKRYSVPR